MNDRASRRTGVPLMIGGLVLTLLCVLLIPRQPEMAIYFSLLVFTAGAVLRCRFWATPFVCGMIALVVMDIKGHRVYGSPRIIEAPVLQNPRIVTHLEPPNRLRFADGSTSTLYGVTILQPIDLTYDEMISPTRLSPDDAALLSMLQYNTGWRYGTPKTLEVEETYRLSDGSCEFRVSVRNVYWCGNTFQAWFWPKDLPSHRVEDLAAVLIWSQAARATNVKAPRDYTSYLDTLQAYDKQVFK